MILFWSNFGPLMFLFRSNLWSIHVLVLVQTLVQLWSIHDLFRSNLGCCPLFGAMSRWGSQESPVKRPGLAQDGPGLAQGWPRAGPGQVQGWPELA